MTQTFRPRWSALLPVGGFGILFLVMLVVSCAIPWLDPKSFHEPQGKWLMAFSIPLWLTMSGLTAWGIYSYSAVYEADASGVTRTVVGMNTRFEWSALSGYEQMGSSGEGYRLRFQDGRKLVLPFNYLEGGRQLRDLLDREVLGKFAQPQSDTEVIESRSGNMAMAIALSLFLLLAMGGGGLYVISSGRPGEQPLGWMCVVMALFVAPALIVAATMQTRLESDRLIRRTCLGTRITPLDDIARLRLTTRYVKGSGRELMTLETTSGRKIYLSPSAETEYVRLRSALLLRCRLAKIEDMRCEADRTPTPRS